jgi:hypothetical protein
VRGFKMDAAGRRGSFDCDGAGTKFVEDIPVVGYIAGIGALFCWQHREWFFRVVD